MKVIELTGKKFGRLTVVKRARKRKKGYGTFWLCKCSCGKSCPIYGSSLRTGLTQSCGCLWMERLQKRTGVNNPFWKGGRRLRKEGYISLRMPNHPNAQKRGRIFEHIYVMSKYLGRPLSKQESVHHKNGIRSDNHIENLELRTSTHPKGQSVKEMVTFCIEYLQRYAPKVLKAT